MKYCTKRRWGASIHLTDPRRTPRGGSASAALVSYSSRRPEGGSSSGPWKRGSARDRDRGDARADGAQRAPRHIPRGKNLTIPARRKAENREIAHSARASATASDPKAVEQHYLSSGGLNFDWVSLPSPVLSLPASPRPERRGNPPPGPARRVAAAAS